MDLRSLNVDLSDLNNVNVQELANGPLPVKIALAVVLAALIVALGWWFGWRDQAAQLERVQMREQELRSTFELRAERAANLEAYEEQLERMQASFGTMLRQLPSRAEVAKLLVDISQTGLSAGLEFELFQPDREVQRDFYAELPVRIRVRGDYHQFGDFVSGVANLPRIVTLHNLDIRPTDNELTMELTARTYWYLEEDSGR
ncbi:pilus assembly protein PilO [Alkalilimnicola ehrlichii]|uniref:Pilus assembly protein PilO n=1 Tax=Alkalilimnicola ehrlichii TaxID=351052 RepID=A0A3E0X4U3_9GAMM|nr:type 4a pilus biogenesis protein PilO [Alkalilimnicola ehrlichii]RFA31158.1 pilus assembly protein PilO [Alkalilimnicola ehrlichii]RFA39556.1 pilus assembly protein PilO [Alkalilimnicola ehrlichii]